MAGNGNRIGDSGGLNWTGSSIRTDSEPMCFHRANLQISERMWNTFGGKVCEKFKFSGLPAILPMRCACCTTPHYQKKCVSCNMQGRKHFSPQLFYQTSLDSLVPQR